MGRKPSEPAAQAAAAAGAPPWTLLADALLQRAALVARVAADRLPSPLAGLQVDDDDVVRLLAELPGLAAGDPGAAARVRAATEPSVDAARRLLVDALYDGGPFGALVRFADLTPWETQVLAVLAAVELDPRRQRLVGYLNDDVTVRWPTPFTLAQLFDGDERMVRAAGPGGGLRRAALLQPADDAPWATARLRLAPAVVWWLCGDRFLDPDLPPEAELVPAEGSGTAELVVVAGPDRVRRLQAVLAAVPSAGLLVTGAPTSPAAWDAVVRQASLEGLCVVLEVADELPAQARARIDRTTHLAWAVSSPADLPLRTLPTRPWTALAVAPPPASSSELDAALGDDVPTAGSLTADQLHAVVGAMRALDGDVEAAIRRLAAGGLDRIATQITPSRTWDDLVLPPDRLELLQDIVVRARHGRRVYGEWGFTAQSTGTIALFSGPSGTGKTLAAEIVAGSLGLELYKVDLSRLVSKYIGETEKNLSEVFEAAEASPVVLFFDEADAILGKRSEVSDAHDRYANIEVAYLLQRMERHTGVVVLATNLASNIDQAFTRRIHVSVHFPVPEAPERRRIWERSIPPGAPCGDVDFGMLAERFEMSGGSIRNAALTAAFLAAEAGTPLTMEALVVAVKRELQKLGRRVRAEDFGAWAEVVAS